jgi:hypothetical protein
MAASVKMPSWPALAAVFFLLGAGQCPDAQKDLVASAAKEREARRVCEAQLQDVIERANATLREQQATIERQGRKLASDDEYESNLREHACDSCYCQECYCLPCVEKDCP